MIDALKCRQVYEILMTPIECTGYSKGTISINKSGNHINSTQTYYPYKKWDISLDEDMSDFAIGFYQIIYKSLLVGNEIMIDGNDDLCDRAFAGDTMNSFNYIARLFPEAGRSRNSRTPKEQWPNILQEWKEQYHCLANFWLIPLEIGRKNDNALSKGSYENGIDDYVDRFLSRISESDKLNVVFSGIYKGIEDFAEKQFLNGSYIYGNASIVTFSNETHTPEVMINKIIDRIKIRATAIAYSDYTIELWDYFHKWHLV